MGKRAVASDSMLQTLRKAVFLDRDGVLNRPLIRDGKPYPPERLEQFEIYPEVPDACRRLKAAGFLLVVATNQPDVGRGTLPQSAVEAIHEEMCKRLSIDRVEVCYAPGGEEPPDERRKPRPGMLLRAARELNIELKESFMVGDRWRDVDCGHAAGCFTIFIDRGYREELREPPHFRASDLAEAARIIIEQAVSGNMMR